MRKVINGITCDTDHAQQLGSARSGRIGDPRHWSEALYRKRAGDYFLYCEGGAASRYSVATAHAGHRIGGRTIVLLTPEEARSWAKRHLSAEKYAEAFTGQEPPRSLGIRLQFPPDIADRIRAAAARKDIKPLRWCEAAILKQIEEEETSHEEDH